MEIGEYVRTKKGKIFKYGKGCAYLGKDNAIIKHSKNIRDLIEVGDILKIYIRDDRKYTLYVPIENERMLKTVQSEDIDIKLLVQVLTHEQYEANCYKLEE